MLRFFVLYIYYQNHRSRSRLGCLTQQMLGVQITVLNPSRDPDAATPDDRRSQLVDLSGLSSLFCWLQVKKEDFGGEGRKPR